MKQAARSGAIEGGDAEDDRAIECVPKTSIFTRALRSSRARRRLFDLAGPESLIRREGDAESE